LHGRSDVSLMDVLGGVSPDYAIVAQKAAIPEVLASFDAVFNAHYGLELPQLAQRYDSKLADLNQRLAAAETQAGSMAGALSHLVSLENKLAHATAQLATVDQRLAQAHASGVAEALGNLSSLQDKLIDASMQLARKQAEVEQLENHAARSLQRAETAAAEAQVAKQQALNQERRAIAAETRILQEEQRALAAEALSEEQTRNAQTALRQFKSLQTKINDLGGDRAQWLQWVNGLEAEHDALLQSWSWRLTAPLRIAASAIKHPKQKLRDGANFAIRHAVDIGQRPLSLVMAQVLRRPHLSHRVNQWLLQRFPALHAQLVAIGRQQGVVPAPSPEAQTSEPTLAELTPRARQIYADLEAAIQKHQEQEGAKHADRH
ncbi:MAG: hypothetical protein ACN6OP_26280, partial [Pseudomonadales bacterium]